MEILPNFVNMALSPAQIADEQGNMVPQNLSTPMYPYGLSICFDQEQLDKLDLSDEVIVGDLIHMHCIAKVTSVSKRDIADGSQNMHVELQITDIAAEDEDEENREAEDVIEPAAHAKLFEKMYK